MLFSKALALFSVISCALAAPGSIPKFVDEFENQKPISSDKFENGDLSAILRTYKVKSPERYGCGGMMKEGQEHYQVASLQLKLKQFNKDGNLVRIKVKEDIFALEPGSRAEMMSADESLLEEMGEEFGLQMDNEKAEAIIARPVKEMSRIEYYEDGEKVKARAARSHCHMPAIVDDSVLIPGRILAVKITGKGEHDDGSGEVYSVYLKNKLEKLDRPIPKKQVVSDSVQIAIWLIITALFVAVLAYGVVIFIKRMTSASHNYLKVSQQVQQGAPQEQLMQEKASR